MRSVSALVVALAFGSLLELVAASNCKPSSPVGVKTTDSTSITSGTATKSARPSETTDGPVIITNAVTNGDFGGYDPSSDGGIYAFQAGGDAKLLQGPGYQGDHTEERNCVQLKTNSGNPGQKRDFISDNPYIQQQLDNLEPSDFTVRFWYSIVNNAIADTCRIEGLYGNAQFGATPYFPVVSEGNSWLEFVDSMPVTTSSGMIRFELNCINGGSAEVYFDQVFVSNKIGDEWVDGISLFFPTSKHAATIAPAQTSTAPPVDTATTSSDNTESSGSPTTQASQAQTTTDEASATDKTIESTSASASASASTSAPTDPTTSGPKLCAKLGTGAAGRGCAKRPYSSTKGYKGYGGSKITKEQCAALCLADTNCQSFEWRYFGSGCANTCNLLATNWADIPTNGGSDSAWAYDRSCIQEDACAEQPAGSVCVNVNADTPAKSCTQVKGKAKACAKPFLTAQTNGVCGLSNECRDLCAKYPSCKSYAATFGSCSLYDARSSEVAEAGSELFWFTDMDCHSCGQGNAYFDYISVGQDPANMPQWTCAAEDKTSSTLAAPTTTKPAITTTSAADAATSTSQASDETDSSTVIPTTTSTSPSTTASLCANGVPSPGICSAANVVPSTATCGKRGWPRNVEPYGRSLADFPNQNTFEECALICKLDRSCNAFAIDPTRSGMKCMFSSDPTIDGVSNAPGVWSDLECMSCTLCDDSVTSSQPVSEAPTTMITSTRLVGEDSSTQAATSALGEPTTTQTTQAEPTDCAVPSASLSDEVTCGIPGQSGQQAQSARLLNYVIKPVGSLANCAAVCLQRADCQGFAYIKSNTECYPFRVGPAGLGITYNPQGTEKYYDRGCFSCAS
ncbi:hypothetical protein FPRO05_09244 [Fusarium proliferatum]|uniref:Apple domain-containing protein n=1 Tax=Gibberella intermedia TaxID=948311 RepID=A0A365NGM1_GIBIN|nr:hypothetical protein FPRO05_09244 [Fusarium proliferatum]